jgi:hypothetical protein
MPATKKLPILLSLGAVLTLGCDAAIVASAQGNAAPEAQADVLVEVKDGEVAEVKAPKGDAAVKVDVEVKAEFKTEALDLESITFLVKKGKIKDAKALEKKINTPKEKLNDLDIDGDGKIDKIVIVEVKKDDGSIIFELHAVPSKSKKKEEAVIVAHVYFTPDKTTNVLIVKATYAPIFIGYDTIVYDYTVPIVVKGDVIVVDGGGGFYGWLYTSHRPVYYGSFVYVVAPAPVFVIDVHHGWHGKGKWKGKGKHWGGKHGKHGKWH